MKKLLTLFLFIPWLHMVAMGKLPISEQYVGPVEQKELFGIKLLVRHLNLEGISSGSSASTDSVLKRLLMCEVNSEPTGFDSNGHTAAVMVIYAPTFFCGNKLRRAWACHC